MDIEDMSIESIETYLEKKKETKFVFKGSAYDFKVEGTTLTVISCGAENIKITDSMDALRQAVKKWEEINNE